MSASTFCGQQELLYDIRAIADLSEVDFDYINKDHKAWVLMKIKPGSTSGAGKLTKGNKLVIVHEGSWELISSLNKPFSQRTGRYFWESSSRLYDKTVARHLIYSPFRDSGLILCRFRSEIKGSPRFDPQLLIFEKWGKYLVNAYRLSLEKNRAKLDGRIVGSLESDNPIISIIAFRELLKGELEANTLDNVLASSSGHKRAIFIYLTLNSANSKDVQLEKSFDKLIKSCQNSDDIKILLTPILSLSFFDPSSENQKIGRLILHKIKRHIATSQINMDSELFLKETLLNLEKNKVESFDSIEGASDNENIYDFMRFVDKDEINSFVSKFKKFIVVIPCPDKAEFVKRFIEIQKLMVTTKRKKASGEIKALPIDGFKHKQQVVIVRYSLESLLEHAEMALSVYSNLREWKKNNLKNAEHLEMLERYMKLYGDLQNNRKEIFEKNVHLHELRFNIEYMDFMINTAEENIVELEGRKDEIIDEIEDISEKIEEVIEVMESSSGDR